MTEQDINKIKALFPEGEVKCTLTENGIVIEKYVIKTENGVNLFYGDEYCWVDTNNGYIISPIIKIDWTSVEEEEDPYPGTSKVFSSFLDAEKWVKENKPRKPLYVDPDNGDEFFKGEELFYYSIVGDMYLIHVDCVENVLKDMEANNCSSKSYNTREKCELALAEFIAGKHGKIVVDSDENKEDDSIIKHLQLNTLDGFNLLK